MNKKDVIRIERGSTKIIAHRGLSGLERENSCPAFVAAGNRDYFGIETDVHGTSDGKLVVIHDDVTGRVSPVDMSVEETPYEELRSLVLYDMDGGSRIDLKIPSLEEYLKICAGYGKIAVLELKNSFAKADIAAILEQVGTFYSMENMIFISFCYENLICIRELCPDAKIQFLCTCEVDQKLVEKLKVYNFDLDIFYKVLDQEKIAFLHANDIEVNCWTVDDPEAAEQLVQWGVDYITTNILL